MGIASLMGQSGYGKGYKLQLSKVAIKGIINEVITGATGGNTRHSYNMTTKRLALMDIANRWIKIFNPKTLTLDYQITLTSTWEDHQSMDTSNTGDLYYGENDSYLTRKFTKATGNTPVWTVNTGRLRSYPSSYDFSSDGLKWYGCDISSTVKERLTSDGSLYRVASIPSGTYIWCIRLDEQNNCLYVVTDGNKLYKLNLSTFTFEAINISVYSNANHMLLTKNYIFLVFAGQLMTVRRSDFTQIAVLNIPVNTLDYQYSTVDYENDQLYIGLLNFKGINVYSHNLTLLFGLNSLTAQDGTVIGHDGAKIIVRRTDEKIDTRNYYAELI